MDHVVDDGQEEGGGLAAARTRPGQHILPIQRERNHRPLDAGGPFPAQLADRLKMEDENNAVK